MTALTLFDCKCPMKCHWMSGGSSGALSTSSWGRGKHGIQGIGADSPLASKRGLTRPVWETARRNLSLLLLTCELPPPPPVPPNLHIVLPKDPVAGRVGFPHSLRRLGLAHSHQSGLHASSAEIGHMQCVCGGGLSKVCVWGGFQLSNSGTMYVCTPNK